MDMELVALDEKPIRYEGTVLLDISSGIITPTHESIRENYENEFVIDLSKLPPGTKRLRLRLL